MLPLTAPPDPKLFHEKISELEKIFIDQTVIV